KAILQHATGHSSTAAASIHSSSSQWSASSSSSSLRFPDFPLFSWLPLPLYSTTAPTVSAIALSVRDCPLLLAASVERVHSLLHSTGVVLEKAPGKVDSSFVFESSRHKREEDEEDDDEGGEGRDGPPKQSVR